VIWRHARDIGQARQVERVVEVIRKPPEDPFEAHRVIAASRSSFVHGSDGKQADLT
jgi:hypothetical protein